MPTRTRAPTHAHTGTNPPPPPQRFNHLLNDLSRAAFDHHKSAVQKLRLELLAAIPDSSLLPESEITNYNFLRDMLDLELKKYESWCYIHNRH